MRIRSFILYLIGSGKALQGSLVEAFQETLGRCFAATVKDMLGPVVSESVYGLLEKNGIRRSEVSYRFDDTVAVLTKALGAASRVLVHKTIVEMFQQYSQRTDFSYQDSLRERLTVLKETVMAQHLVPKNQHERVDFDSVEIVTRSTGSLENRSIYG